MPIRTAARALPRASLWTFTALLAACAAEIGEVDPEPGVITEEIAAEVPGEAVRVHTVYGASGVRTLRSYATVSIEGCSGTMIGPNILLTAAHCRAEVSKTAVFHAYVDATTQRTERFTCRYLVHGWPEHDLVLFWCDPDASGVNPGDRWGWVDLDVDVNAGGTLLGDASHARVTRDAGVYSIWSNRIDDVDGNLHHLYSEGVITSTNHQGWFNPGGHACRNDDDLAIGVFTDVYGAGGASGSSQLSASTHRLLLGPLSTVSSSSGGRGRQSAAIVDLLTRGMLTTDDTTGSCADRARSQVSLTMLQTLWDRGIRFDANRENDEKYYGRALDSDRNGMFDVMQDLERSAGESERSVYDLGFESIRRNALWTRGPRTGITVQPTTGEARASLDSDRGEYFTLLTHERLHLDPARRYRVRYRVTAGGASTVILCGGPGDCETHALGAGATAVFVDEIQGAPSIQLIARGSGTISVRDIAVIEVGALLTFDSHDERTIWRSTPASGASQAVVLPLGRDSATRVDWAGSVRQYSILGVTLTQRLVSSAVAVPPGRMRVCFDHRARGSSTGGGRLTIQGANGAALSFQPRVEWERACSAWVEAPRSDTAVAFDVAGSGNASYLVDDVLVEHAPSRVVAGSISVADLERAEGRVGRATGLRSDDVAAQEMHRER